MIRRNLFDLSLVATIIFLLTVFTVTSKGNFLQNNSNISTDTAKISELYISESISGNLKKIESFDTTSFTKNNYVSQALITPPLEGTKSLQVIFKKGGTWANLAKTYSSKKDMSGKYLHIDVLATNSTLNFPSTPTIKLISNNQVIMEDRLPVRVGEWTGLNFDISSKNQSLLSQVDRIELYLADSINPGNAKYLLDNLYVSTVPMPKKNNPITLIVAGISPEQANNYKQLTTSKSKFVFRSMKYDINDSVIRSWDSNNINYFFSAGSSDFPKYQTKSLYVPLDNIYEVINRPASLGVYLHENISYLALQNGWNWTQAVNAFDWKWLDRIAAYTKYKNKKIIWSEPASAWKYLSSDSRANTFFKEWKDVVVPMFATNFQSESSGYLMTEARDSASEIAGEYGMYLGESHQAWYFYDQGKNPSQAESLALARLGFDQNASYFQFEGNPSDMDWNSLYMKGIQDFIVWLQQTPL